MATKITGTNTAAAPGVTGDDTDTGLFYGTNEIGFSTGGTSRLTLDSSGLLNFPDNGKIRFGTGNDSEIFFNGSNTFFRANAGSIHFDDGTDSWLSLNPNGSCDLYYDGSKKFQTASHGINIENPSSTSFLAQVSTSAGVAGFIKGNSSTDLGFQDSQQHWTVKGIKDGAVELYYDNSRMLRTTATGGILSGSWSLTDNNKMLFGTSDDLQIYHDGSNSYIQDSGTGNLILQATDFQVKGYNTGEVSIAAAENGAVELYHNNFKSFQTDSNGVIVYGPEGGDAFIYLYGDEGDDDADKWRFVAYPSTSKFLLQNKAGGGWETNIQALGSAGTSLSYDNSTRLETTADGIKVSSTTGLASSIIQTSAASDVELEFVNTNSSNRTWAIGLDNSNSKAFVVATAAATSASLTGDDQAIVCIPDGPVQLYHNGNERLQTDDDGVNIGANNSDPERLTVRYSTVPTHLSSSFDGTWAESFFSVNKWRNSDASGSWTGSANTSYASAAVGLLGGTSSSTIKLFTAASPNTDPTPKLEVWSTGDVNIVDGNLKVASGHGIDFSATSDASGATSELLDDYEEGTWTPVYQSSNGTFGYTTQEGWYTKVGNLVTVRGYIRTSSVSSTSHSLVKMAGLPFQVAKRTPLSIRAWGMQGSGFDDFPTAATFEHNQTYLELLKYGTGGTTDFTTSTMNNDCYVVICGSYMVD